MAIAKDPYQAGGVRGSIGGATFSIYKGQITFRTRTKPARRLRTTQPRNRSILGFLSREWGNLTDAQRALWEAYALDHPRSNAFGQEFIMSGINAFSSLNHTIIRMGGFGAYITDPPVEDPQASLTALTVTTGATNPGDIDLTWDFMGTESASDFVEIRIAGPFISPGKQEVFERKKFSKTVAGNLDLTTLTGLVEEQWYHVFVRYVDIYGQTTAWQTGKATPKVTV